jgi:hypothetical protein
VGVMAGRDAYGLALGTAFLFFIVSFYILSFFFRNRTAATTSALLFV